MSMPPAALAIITGLPAARSSTMLRYSSRVHLQPFFDQHAADDAAFGAGLMRDERHADHRRSRALGLVGRLRQLDAAAFAAAAGVNLRLDDDDLRAEAPRDRRRARRRSKATSPRGTGTPWRARIAFA